MKEYLERYFTNMVSIFPWPIRRIVYKLILGKKINKFFIGKKVIFSSPKIIKIGNGCYINKGVEFYAGPSKDVTVELSDNTWIGPNSFSVVHHTKLEMRIKEQEKAIMNQSL